MHAVYLNLSGRLLSTTGDCADVEPGNLYPIDLEATPDNPLLARALPIVDGGTVDLFGRLYLVNDLGPARWEDAPTVELTLVHPDLFNEDEGVLIGDLRQPESLRGLTPGDRENVCACIAHLANLARAVAWLAALNTPEGAGVLPPAFAYLDNPDGGPDWLRLQADAERAIDWATGRDFEGVR